MAPQPWNLGPPVQNFSGLANLGAQFNSGYDSARKRTADEEKRALLASVATGGDLSKLGMGLIASGDVANGAALLTVAQKQAEKAEEAKWFQNNNGVFGGGSPAASAPLPRLGQAAAPAGGVRVANSEEDVQRLEAEASGLTQAGQRSEPRGLRNNNPGNIESGRFAATVQGFEGSDGRFARYATPEQGIQAADKLLTSYAARGLNTVAGIVNRWAPPTENNTGAYVAQVAKELGVDPNQPLDMSQPEVRQKLIAAKIRVENGKQPYSEDVFQRALNPNWGREVASFEGAGAQPVQVAEAPAQPGQPVADVPQGAQAQFVIPGTTPQQTAAITADPQVRNLLRALDGAPDRFKAGIQKRLDLRIEELKQARGDEGRQADLELKRIQVESERRKLAGDIPSPGYRFKPGTKDLEPIPGGPADDKTAREIANRTAVADQRGLQGDAREAFIYNGRVPVGTEKAATEGQANAALYADRMKEAEAIFAQPGVTEAAMSRTQKGLSQVPIIGNKLVSSNFQRVDQAQRNFINATLRRESGAVISESEFENARKQYFPQPDDGAAVLEDKRKNRQTAIQGIANAAGPSYAKRQGQEPQAQAQSQPPQQMPAPAVPGGRVAPDGNTYVPDPNRPGKYLMVQP